MTFSGRTINPSLNNYDVMIFDIIKFWYNSNQYYINKFSAIIFFLKTNINIKSNNVVFNLYSDQKSDTLFSIFYD